jgi:hypothetical protein
MTLLADWPNLFGGGQARLLSGMLDGVDVPAYVLDVPGFFNRAGNPYLDAEGRDWNWRAGSIRIGDPISCMAMIGRPV